MTIRMQNDRDIQSGLPVVLYHAVMATAFGSELASLSVSLCCKSMVNTSIIHCQGVSLNK